MRPGVLELRWAYVVFALLAGIDILIFSRSVAVLAHRNQVPIPQEAPLLLMCLLGLHGLLLWLALRLKHVVAYYRRLKEAYEQELDFAQQVMESVGHGLTVSDDNGRFVYVNKAYADMLGLPAAEILGRSPFDFTVEDDHVSLTEARERREAGSSSTYMTRLRRANGELLTVQVTGTPRWHQGRVVGAFAAVVPWAVSERNGELIAF